MPELKGCIAHGETQDEVLKEINLLAKEWLDLAQEKGWQIPEAKRKTYVCIRHVKFNSFKCRLIIYKMI